MLYICIKADIIYNYFSSQAKEAALHQLICVVNKTYNIIILLYIISIPNDFHDIIRSKVMLILGFGI
jgi:hypothetical protein